MKPEIDKIESLLLTARSFYNTTVCDEAQEQLTKLVVYISELEQQLKDAHKEYEDAQKIYDECKTMLQKRKQQLGVVG